MVVSGAKEQVNIQQPTSNIERPTVSAGQALDVLVASGISLAPGFSRVKPDVGPGKPFQRFASGLAHTGAAKPLKRLGLTLGDGITWLKSGANGRGDEHRFAPCLRAAGVCPSQECAVRLS
jgi:hypothetical protein